MSVRFNRLATIALALTGSCLAVACSGDQATTNSTNVSVASTTTTAPQFQPDQVDPVRAAVLSQPQDDPGLHVTFTLQSTDYNSQGAGCVIYVLVENDNDVALPIEALGIPTLTVSGQAVPPVQEGSRGLDLPLGAHSAANLAFAFNTSYNNLYAATFTIGNVIFEGNLANA